MVKRWGLVCLLAVTVTFAGLVTAGVLPGEAAPERYIQSPPKPLMRLHDNDLRVTCWLAEGSGLSCLPDSQLSNPSWWLLERQWDGPFPMPTVTPVPK